MFNKILELIFLSLVAIFFIALFVSFLSGKKNKRKLLQKRNLFYPIDLLATAHKNSSLQKYISDLTDECAGFVFSQGWKSYEKYKELAPDEIEKICIYNSKKIPSSWDWQQESCACVDGWYPFGTFYMFREYLKNKLTKEGAECVQKILYAHKGPAYKALLDQGEKSHKEFSMVYNDAFFDSISRLEDLEKYPGAVDFMIETYAQKKASLSALQLLNRFMSENNLKIYELLVERCAKKDSKELSRIYKDDFFSRISTLKQLQTFPQAFSYLIESYLANTAGPFAKVLVAKLLIHNSKALYQQMFSILYNNKDKEFALKMIQEYSYLSRDIKIGILSCKQGSRYVDASIQKLKELEEPVNPKDDEWSLLFKAISKLLNSELKPPRNLTELKKVKKLLEFHRDNANSNGDMLKVLDIEKMLENMEKEEKKFSEV